MILKVEKPNLFQVNEWVKLSNINTESSVGAILNDGGLTHVFKVKSANGKIVTLDDAARYFIPSSQAQIYDSWGEVGYGYTAYDVSNSDGLTPVDLGLYEFHNGTYELSEDSEFVSGKTYYQQYYPSYTTVPFARQYSEEDAAQYENLTNYFDLKKNANDYIQLNAPRYELFFNDTGYIKR